MPQPFVNPNYFGQYQYANIPQPMDRLSQLQAPYQQAVPQGPPQTNQGILWVQGDAGAKSYLVAPNTTVLLMDSESQRFYLKSTDGSGMPNLRTFEYVEITHNAAQPVQNISDNLDEKYVTREEYRSLQEQYTEILDKLTNFPVSAADAEPVKKSPARSGTGRSKGGNADE